MGSGSQRNGWKGLCVLVAIALCLASDRNIKFRDTVGGYEEGRSNHEPASHLAVDDHCCEEVGICIVVWSEGPSVAER